jgi:hypothetical protein
MTEVEFSRLMSDLTETAKTLNRESDSINAIIERFETMLQRMNLGLEVWLVNEPLASEHWSVEPDEGTRETQLGFAKLLEWRLVTREATYRVTYDENDEKTFDLLSTNSASPLSSASRAIRILALARFPSSPGS